MALVFPTEKELIKMQEEARQREYDLGKEIGQRIIAERGMELSSKFKSDASAGHGQTSIDITEYIPYNKRSLRCFLDIYKIMEGIENTAHAATGLFCVVNRKDDGWFINFVWKNE